MTSPRMRRTWLAVALTVPALVLLLAGAWRYLPFISDDALISLRYAQRLLTGHGLSWTDGRPVEGYSNLLWILLVAALGAVGIDLVDASRALGIVGMAVAVASIGVRAARRGDLKTAWFPAALGTLMVAGAAPVSVWAVGGLEQPLCAALLALSILAAFGVLESTGAERRPLLGLSLLLGLLCLSRPDGAIFAAAGAVAMFVGRLPVRGRRAVADGALLLVGPVVLGGAQLVFRVLYYGELLPNTALVKLALGPARLDGGLRYVAAGLQSLAPLSWLGLASLVGLIVARRSRPRGLYLLSMALPWAIYLVVIGGDIFPAYRHFVPLVVVLGFALSEGAGELADRLAARRVALFVAMAVGVACLVPYGYRQVTDKQSRRALTERWEWDGQELGLMLKAAFGARQPVVAVTAAGAIPFWSELPALDMLGLNDYFIPRHPPAGFGSGMIGHELGDGRYVLEQNPDIIVFSIGSGPAYRPGQELAGLPEFHDRYVPVVLRTPGRDYSAIVYISRESTRVGVRQAAGGLSVPGYLFTGPRTVARLNGSGRLVARVDGGTEARVRVRVGSASGWSARVSATGSGALVAGLETSGEWLTLTVRAADRGPLELEAVALGSPTPVTAPPGK